MLEEKEVKELYIQDLKKGKSSNTSKAREADGQMYDKLARSFLSTVELDEIYRQASNMDF